MASRKPADEDYIDIDDTYDANQDDDAGNGGYAWEEEYKRSWDILQEDSEGRLSSVVSQLQQQRKRRRYRNILKACQPCRETEQIPIQIDC